MSRVKFGSYLGIGVCVAFSLLVVQPGFSQDTEARVDIQVDGQIVASPTLTVGEGGIFTLPSFEITTGAGDIISLQNVILKSDPFITYGFNVTDVGAPSSFGFLFVSPVAPAVDNPASVFASVGFGLTPGASQPATISPLLGDPFLAVNILGPGFQNAGVDVGNISGGFSTTGPGSTPFSESAGTILTPASGPFTSMGTTLSFSLSGDGAAVGGSGNFVINQIPEPATSALVGLGLLGLVALRRAKSKV